MKHPTLWALFALALFLTIPTFVFAQAAGVKIFDDATLLEQITADGRKLLDAKQLIPLPTHVQQLSRSRCKLTLLPPRTARLESIQVCETAERGTLAVGLLARDRESGEWYFNSATGFILTADGAVATCYHVLHNDEEQPSVQKEREKKDGEKPGKPKPEKKEKFEKEKPEGKRIPESTPESKPKPGNTESTTQPDESYLIAADFHGHVYPVLEVLAADKVADTCILRIQASGLEPLPLNPESRPGEHVYCYSNPSDMFGYFSKGIIARFFLFREGEDQLAKKGRGVCFLSITSDFAVGSSGGPILDDRGNVVGQVQSTSSIFADPDDEHPQHPQMVVKAALAVREILTLIEQPQGEALVAKSGDKSQEQPGHTSIEKTTTKPESSGPAFNTIPMTETLHPPSRIALHFKRIQDTYESQSKEIAMLLEAAETEEQLQELSTRASDLLARTELRSFRLVNAHTEDPDIITALEFLLLESPNYRARAFELLSRNHITAPEVGRTCMLLRSAILHCPNTEQSDRWSQLEKLSRAVVQHNGHREAVGLATLTLAQALISQCGAASSDPEERSLRVQEAQSLLTTVKRNFSEVRIPSVRSDSLNSQSAGTQAQEELDALHAEARANIMNKLHLKTKSAQ
jgi:hypothetical protein